MERLQETITKNHEKAYKEYLIKKHKEDKKNKIIIYTAIIFITSITSMFLISLYNINDNNYKKAVDGCIKNGNIKSYCEYKMGE